MNASVRWLIGAAVASAAMALSGCAGHGRYTGEFKKQAELRMRSVKAATQYDMAMQQFLAGDLKKAEQSIVVSTELQADSARARVLHGRVLIELGRLEGAMAALNKAIELEPKSDEAQYYRGIVFERIGRTEDALACFERAGEADPTNPQYPVAAAEMLVTLGRIDDAEALLLSGAESMRHNAGVRQSLGHIATLRGDHARAAELFGEAVLLAPEDSGVKEDHARALAASQRFGEAESVLRRLLTGPGDKRRDLRLLRGNCLVELGRMVEARTMLNELVSEPGGETDFRAWNEVGNLAAVMGETHRARESAVRLMALAPERVEGYVLMAWWLRQRGETEQALTTLEHAATLSTTDVTAPMLAGLILRDIGRDADAAGAFAMALRRDPTNAEARMLLEAAGGSGSAVAGVDDER